MVLLSAFAAAGSSIPAVAQTTDPGAHGGDELAEVVVTARQREEKLVNVPVTEEVFTATALRDAGVERPQDFIALTPGVSQVQTAEVGDMQVSIRGINTGRDAEGNFAFVVDGVLQTNPNGFNQEFANIDQIEVAKGPQGATYGRNAVAGAIIVTTKKPTDQFTADVTAGVGNKDTYKANFYVGGPLAGGVDAGLGAYFRNTNGFFHNSYLNCDNCADYQKEYGFTPRLIFNVGDNGTIDVKAKYAHVSAGAINFNAVFALPAFGALNPDFFQDVNAHQFDYINNIVPQNVQNTYQFSVKGDWKLDFGTLTAWAAYADETNYFLTDGTSAAFGLYAAVPKCQADIANKVGGPLPSPTFYAGAASILPAYSPSSCDGYQYQQRDQRDASFEVRLTSPNDQPLRWQGGVYLADIKRHVVVAQGSDPGNGDLLAQAFVPTSGPNPTDLLFDDDFESKVGAVFGQIAYDIVPTVEVAFAGRFDSEKRTVDNEVPKVNPQTVGFGPFGTPVCGPTGPNAACNYYINPYYNVNPAAASIPGRSATYDQFQPKFTVDWKIEDGVSLFGSYGYGFRSGGFNSSGSEATVQQYFGKLFYVDPSGKTTTTPALPIASAAYPNGVSDEYKKEVSKAAELGIKAELFDRTLFLGASLYRTKVDNMQIFNFFAGPFGLLRVVTNIDEATLKGVEGDVKWRATPYFTVFAGIGTVDSTIDSYSGRPYTAGNKVPYAPSYTGDAGINFNAPLAPRLSLFGQVDVSAVGPTWFSAVQDNQVQTLFGVPGDFSKTERNSYQLLNARFGVRGDNWDVAAWSNNLANKQYLAEVIPAPEFGGSFVHSGTGRAFGLDVSYRFGGGAAPVSKEVAVEPPPAPMAAAAPPLDSDGDGVPDSLDKCPNTPKGVAVDASGCPLDSDHDGVPDYLDKCPGTPAGMKVDANGCEIEEMVLKGVNFETDSAKLLPGSTATLDEVVGLLKRRPGADAEIDGYTDAAGSAAHNLKLSERRATAVKEYLVDHGIPAGTLTARGFGAANPVANNATKEGRAENRRVTLKFATLATK
jgi:iron complex outermembrane receptor protein